MEEWKYLRFILPHEGYKPRMDMNGLLAKERSLTVVRRSPVPFELIGPRGDLLSEDCVTENIFNYSMNLLGGEFQVGLHLAIRQKGRGVDDWDGETFLSDEEIAVCWELVDASYPIYYRVSDLQNVEIPYKKRIGKESEYKALQDQMIAQDVRAAMSVWDPADPVVSFKGFMRVNHAPTLMNYWHVTLDVYESFAPEKPLKKSKSAWNAEIRGYVFDYLRRYYLHETEVVAYTIAPCWFMKNME